MRIGGFGSGQPRMAAALAVLLVCLSAWGRDVRAQPIFTVVVPASGVVQFGNVVVGSMSGPQTVRIQNDGTTDLTISGVSLSGTDAAAFAFNGPSVPVVVTPGSSVDWTSTCSPATTGSKTATLSFTHDDVANSPGQVVLSCSGVPSEPTLSLDPTSLSFGDVRVCEKRDLGLLLHNTGYVKLHVSSISSTDAHYTVAAGLTPPLTMDPNAQTTQTVRFAPTAGGAVNATLVLQSDDPNSPTMVPLAGNGVVAQAGINETSHDFGDVRIDQPFPSEVLTIENTGSASFDVTSLVLSNTTDFDVVPVSPATLPATLTPSGIATIRVTARPQSIGAKSTSLTINTDIPGPPCGMTPISVSVAANGVTGQLTFDSASPLNLGPVCVGGAAVRRTISATNTGAGSISISSISIDNNTDFALDLTGVSLVDPVGPSQKISFDVVVQPQSEGAISATVSIQSDVPGGNALALEATALRSGLGASPDSIDFGDADLGVTTAEQSITVRNCSSATATLTGVGLAGPNSTDFAITTGELPPPNITLMEGDAQTWAVTFTPIGPGLRSATFTAAVESGTSLDVALSGSGNPLGGPDAGLGPDRDASVGASLNDNTYYACAASENAAGLWLLPVLGMILVIRKRR